MAASPTQRLSSYLDYLPALFRHAADSDGVNVLGHFLLAFEQMLTGLGDPNRPGLEEQLDGIRDSEGHWRLLGIERFFDPAPELLDDRDNSRRAPDQFLDWLASWVALSLRDDWSSDEKRRFISQIVPLYRQRGTRAGLIAILRAYTGLTAENAVRVDEFPDLPHYFQVQLSLGLHQNDPNLRTSVERKEQIARAIIDQEKPAHTFYALRITGVPTMRLGVRDRSTLGESTLLGSPDVEEQ
jgi:P2-related tail formation protein